jgi:hypothetical protein
MASRVSAPIARKLVTIHGSCFPDRPIAVLRMRELRQLASKEFIEHLDESILVLSRTEFSAWYESERRRGLWLSQRRRAPRTENARRPGRPRLSDQLSDTILALVRSKSWGGDQSVRKLRGLLKARLQESVASEDTLCRRLDELFLETGEPDLRRRRYRRRAVQSSIPQN